MRKEKDSTCAKKNLDVWTRTISLSLKKMKGKKRHSFHAPGKRGKSSRFSNRNKVAKREGGSYLSGEEKKSHVCL